MATREELLTYLAPIVQSATAVLEDVTITPAGRSRVISVIVDSESHNLSLDEVTGISRKVSEALDNFSKLDDKPFTLEVTSPGVDRPLTAERHWRKNIGRLVKVTLNNGEVVTGRLSALDNSDVSLTLPKTEKKISRAEIKRAVIEIEFNRKAGA
jgi:ribosome maturation factor RimP